MVSSQFRKTFSPCSSHSRSWPRLSGPLLLLGSVQLFMLITPALARGRLPLAQPFLAAIDSAPTSPAVSKFVLVLPVFSFPARAWLRSLRRTRLQPQHWLSALPVSRLPRSEERRVGKE